MLPTIIIVSVLDHIGIHVRTYNNARKVRYIAF